MNANEYLASLTDKSAWVFTKQETNFEESFRATKLFSDICEKPNINIEKYFAEHHEQYGIRTDRHRILVIPQLFGLITKTPFYAKGIQYNKERPTEIFDLIKNENENSRLYNIIKTEQILKIKIHSIIDTANNNESYAVLPVIVIYKILKELQQKYGMNEVPLDYFYTYIITCKSYDDIDNAINFIAQKGPISKYVKDYKDRSRILTIIRNNIYLFNVTANSISINPVFDNYFYNNFMNKYDLEDLHNQLLRDVDYSYLFYNSQNFNINLIDTPTTQVSISQTQPILIEDEETIEKEYLDKVDSIKESNVNDDVANEAYKTAPIPLKNKKAGRKFKTNPLLGKIAIKHAYYSCENNYEHKTFESKKTHKPYMEAHHLIPIANQQEVWEEYNINLDCIENLVSLCPTCHKAFHYGTDKVKTEMIENLFKKLVHKYKAIGFDISIEDIKKLYGIK